MLTETKIDHSKLAAGTLIAEHEIFQLEIAMDDAPIVNVADSIDNLLDEPGAFGLGVVNVLLRIETVEEVAPQTQLLNEVDGRRTFVHLLEPDDVGMVQLAHDGNLNGESMQNKIIV